MADLLVELLENDPYVEEINLDFKDIDELESILPLLSKFPNLKALSLSDNRIVSVPDDLSCLEHVEDINLNGNIFEDLKQVILALTTMPSLRSLHINLHEEEQVDFIFRNMPHLEMLNDTEVEREELEGEDNQTYEEEEHDMINGDAHTPGEREEVDRHQRNTDEDSDDKQDLNDDQNQAAHEDMEGEGDYNQKLESGEDIEDIVIKPEDLEIIAVLYDSIRGLRRRIDEENDKNLADDFDRHLKNVMTELKESLTTDDPTHIKNANLLKAKFSLHEICFTKAVEYLKAMDEEVGDVFEKIQDIYNSIFGNCYELIRTSGGNDTEAIRNQLIEKENEATEVIETANELNKRFEKEMKEKETLKRNFERERNQLK